MRALIVLSAFVLMCSAAPAAVAQQSTNTQQDRMKSCNTEAGAQHLSGDARKTFMSNCLAGKTTAGSGTSGSTMTQQDKMKACNVQASTQKLTGDARKSFMSNCLKAQ